MTETKIHRCKEFKKAQKDTEYELRIQSEDNKEWTFESSGFRTIHDIVIIYCPFCGKRLTEEK